MAEHTFLKPLMQIFKTTPRDFGPSSNLNPETPAFQELFPWEQVNRTASVRSASCPQDIAELFNDYFTSVLNSNDDLIDSTTLPSTTQCEPIISELNLSPEDVLVCLRTLDVNKATGPDGISPRLLKETAHRISPSLSTLFNQSLDSGSLPEEWKLVNIIPVFKKGDKSFVENYRPISLLCVVFECCVLNKLHDHLLQRLNSSQHGFTPGRSCSTQLVEVLNYIGSLLDSGKQTDVIFMDMSKAFDKVSHAALVNKLANYGIRGSLLNWFSHYLHGRQQLVTTLGGMSSKKTVSSGVPQGSILGPILFLLYVNDLPDAIEN